jgi:hypothetical protein
MHFKILIAALHYTTSNIAAGYTNNILLLLMWLWINKPNEQSINKNCTYTYLITIIVKHSINEVFKHYVFVCCHKAVTQEIGGKFYHILIGVTQHAQQVEEQRTTELNIAALQELHKACKCSESHLCSHILQTQPQAWQIRLHHSSIPATSENSNSRK